MKEVAHGSGEKIRFTNSFFTHTVNLLESSDVAKQLNGLADLATKVAAGNYLQNKTQLEKWLLDEFLGRESYASVDPFMITECMLRRNSWLELESRSFIDSFFTRYQWDKGILDQWFQYKNNFSFPEQIARNLSNMCFMTKERVDVVNTLFHEFKIIHFGNYPSHILESQYRERDNCAKPYGIVMFPKYDHNGAFREATFGLHQLVSKLERASYLVRVIEVGGTGDIVKMLIRLNKKYGGSHKISFMLVGAHGTRDSLLFGNPTLNEFSARVNKENIEKSRTKQLRGYFIPYPTIVLLSCSTGQENGIAQKISEQLEAFVAAPEEDTHLDKIEVNNLGESVQFSVVYKEGKTRWYVPKNYFS